MIRYASLVETALILINECGDDYNYAVTLISEAYGLRDDQINLFERSLNAALGF